MSPRGSPDCFLAPGMRGEWCGVRWAVCRAVWVEIDESLGELWVWWCEVRGVWVEIGELAGEPRLLPGSWGCEEWGGDR